MVNTLRNAWPQTHFSWIIGKPEATLIGDVPGIEFIVFDKRSGWKAYRDLHRHLAQRRFDLLLHMQMSLRASLASLAVHAPIRLGFDRIRAHDFQWLFTTHRIPHVEREMVMDSFFGFARAVGVTEKQLLWNIPIPARARAEARILVPDSRPLLLLNPCANPRFRNWRDWPYARYAPVAKFAVERLGWQVAITGGTNAGEAAAAEQILRASRVPILNLQGRTPLKTLLALIARARVLISPDSGPVHMATAVGTPVIGLYASTNPDRAGPYCSQQWRVNYYPEALQHLAGKQVSKAPWGTRVRHAEAMALIPPEEVIERLRACAKATAASSRSPDVSWL